jgi:hypothetical protein
LELENRRAPVIGAEMGQPIRQSVLLKPIDKGEPENQAFFIQNMVFCTR